jgi:hypothetical protein
MPAPAYAPRRSPVPPRPRRPDELRLAHRLAAGVPKARAAAAERIAEAELDALLARPDFAELLSTVRELRDLPDDEKLAKLEAAAWTVLQLALADGDVRAALFVMHERRLGRDPRRTLATRAIAAERRAAATAEPRPAPAPAPRPPALPGPGRWAKDVARRLRQAVVREHALTREAEPPAAPPAREAIPAADRPAPGPPPLNRHQRRRLAALRRRLPPKARSP